MGNLPLIYLILALSGFLNLLVALLVFSKNTKSLRHIVFAILSLGLATWNFAFLFYNQPIIFDTFFWIKAIYFVGAVIAANVFYFSYAFPDNETPPKVFQIAFFALNIPLLYLVLTDQVISGVEVTNYGFESSLGPFYWLVIVAWVPFALLAIYRSIKNYLASTGKVKLQFLYIFLGFSILTSAAILGDGIAPIFFGTSQYFPYAAASAFFFVGLTGYSIIRHRLLDIRIALESTTQFLIKASIVIVFALVVAAVNDLVTNQPFDPNVVPLILIAAFTFTLFFDRLGAWVKDLTDHYLFHSLYDYQTTLRDLSQSLANILDLDKLVEAISAVILTSLKAERIAVVVLDKEGRFSLQKTQGFEASQCWWLIGNNAIMGDIATNRRVLVTEELRQAYQEATDGTREALKRMVDVMASVEAAVIVPVFNKDKLSAVIVIGERRSGNAFTVEDINLLSTVSGQFAIALENADLYEEVEEANRDLQKKIEVATMELRKKNSEIGKAFEDLKSLDVMKNQLIAVTSHELKTPATVVQNYLWVVLNEPDAETKLTDSDKTKLRKSFNGIQNLIRLINDILNVSRIEGGKMAVDITDVEPKEVIAQAIEDYMPKAEEKKLRLTFEPTEFSKKIRADKDKLYEVLTNLISNAIKYTDAGNIEVRIEEREGSAVMSVSDTGRGIARENFGHVFGKFYREDASLSASNVMTGGTGLGLYITKSYIDLMNGKIWVESEKGKGSTFSFSLPIAS